MRSRPTNLPATSAASEWLIIYLGQGLELIKDFGFLRRFKQGVAAEAASKWSQSGAQIESVQNLESLFHRLLRTQVVAVPDDCMHQQTPVAGQQSTVLAAGDRHQLSILGRGIVNDVDAAKAKIPDKFTQMSIGNKTSDFCELQPIFCERSNSACADWLNLDTGFAVNKAGTTNWNTVMHKQIDFGLRE